METPKKNLGRWELHQRMHSHLIICRHMQNSPATPSGGAQWLRIPQHVGQRSARLENNAYPYFLFVYDGQFDYEFHRQSLIEILRVTSGEARIYPLVNFKAQRSQWIERIKMDSAFAGWNFEEVETDFEFLRGSNSFLKIRKLNRAGC